jgi:hypothetical protein
MFRFHFHFHLLLLLLFYVGALASLAAAGCKSTVLF